MTLYSRLATAGEFIDGSDGRIFVLLRAPPGARVGVLVVPPFAEEMNKCRRMITELAQRLAKLGIAVVVPDLFGTGDSAGEFSDGRWRSWQGDIQHAGSWCEARGIRPAGLLGIRLGAALAASAATIGRVPGFDRTVLWQPVFNGSKFVAQFLRLRAAASMTGSGPRESVNDLKKRLVGGETIEVAGYELSGTLVAELDALEVPERLPKQLGRVHWMEIQRDGSVPAPTPATQLVESTRRAGGAVEFQVLRGEPFWTSTEIVINEAVLEATANCFAGLASFGSPAGWT